MKLGLFAHLLAEDIYRVMFAPLDLMMGEGYDFEKRNQIEAWIMRFLKEHGITEIQSQISKWEEEGNHEIAA